MTKQQTFPQIFIRFFVGGIGFGALVGIITGIVEEPGNLFLALFVGIVLGVVLATPAGLFAGLVGAWLTTSFFSPLRSPLIFRVSLSAVVTIPVLVALWALFPNGLGNLMGLTAIIGGTLSALIVCQWVAGWYINAEESVQPLHSPRLTPDNRSETSE